MQKDIYRSVITSLPVVLFVIDSDGVFTLSEGKGLENLGLKPSQVAGMKITDVYGDHPEIIKSFERALQGEFVRSTSIIDTRFFDTLYSPCTDPAGHITGVVGVAIDITERMHAEHALARTKEELEEFFFHSNDLICIVDKQGNFLRSNPEWERHLGYAASALTGKRYLDFIHPEDKPATLESLAELTADHPVTGITNRYKRKDGQYCYLEWRAFSLGNVIYAIARDVTDRIQIEKRLRKIENRYQELFEHSPLGIFQSTFEGRFINLNNTFASMLGYVSPDDLKASIRLNEELYRDPSDRARMVTMLKEKGYVYDFQVQILRKDGKYIWMAVYARIIADPESGDLILDGFCLDTSVQQEASEILKNREAFSNELLLLSRVLFNVQDAGLGYSLNLALEKIGSFCHVDRAYIFQFDQPEGNTVSNTYEWTAEGVSSEMANLQQLPCDMFPNWMEKLRNNEIIYIPSLKDLPEHWYNEKSILESQGIMSLIVVPVMIRKKLTGFFGFDAVRNYRRWNKDEISLLYLMSDLIAGAIRLSAPPA